MLATCYSQVGVLAVDAAGNVAAVDDLQARPDPNVEYHCQFRQVTKPEAMAVAIDNQRFLHGPVLVGTLSPCWRRPPRS